jgi:hypothetical protein
MQRDAITIVCCVVGAKPLARTIAPDLESLRAIVRGNVEIQSYPRQLASVSQSHLVVVVNENAINDPRCIQNRWGVVGDFAVVRQCKSGTFTSLTEQEAARVCEHLLTEYGYYDPTSGGGFICSRELGFVSRRSKSADVFGDQWDPDLNLIGMLRWPEIKFMNWLLGQFAENVVAHHFHQPFPSTFGIELQFGDSVQDQLALGECKRLFHGAFDRHGNLKRDVALRPPQPRILGKSSH